MNSHGDHLWNYIDGLREDLGRAEARISDLQDDLDALRNDIRQDVPRLAERIAALERQTPQARQLEYEADLVAADLAASGYDRHGRDCDCPCCYTEPEDYDPGPEVDDEGGMSEYRYAVLPAEEDW